MKTGCTVQLSGPSYIYSGMFRRRGIRDKHTFMAASDVCLVPEMAQTCIFPGAKSRFNVRALFCHLKRGTGNDEASVKGNC